MMCYKDMTFCSAFSTKCINYKCHRALTEEVIRGANKWWGSEKAPIAVSDFYDVCDVKIIKPVNSSIKQINCYIVSGELMA